MPELAPPSIEPPRKHLQPIRETDMLYRRLLQLESCAIRHSSRSTRRKLQTLLARFETELRDAGLLPHTHANPGNRELISTELEGQSPDTHRHPSTNPTTPSNRTFPAQTALNTHQAPKPRKRPPTRRRRNTLLPITSMASFRQLHHFADRVIKTYLQAGRFRQKLGVEAYREIEPPQPRYIDELWANNAASRINYAEITLRHIAEVDAPRFFFVTLTPAQFAMREKEAINFDVRKIQSWTRYVLSGFDFVGMVEVALFPDHPSNGINNFSWHVHLIVWNTSYSRLNRVLRTIRQDVASFVRGMPSAHCRRPQTQKDILRKALYMMKAPQKRYRVGASRGKTMMDPCTGEVLPKLYINKDDLRTGQRVRLCRVFAGKRLNKLLFSQRAGTPVVQAINQEALEPLRRWELSENAKRDRSRHSFAVRRR